MKNKLPQWEGHTWTPTDGIGKNWYAAWNTGKWDELTVYLKSKEGREEYKRVWGMKMPWKIL